LLTFYSGEASGWRRLPEEDEGWVSNAKPNAISKTKLKMLPFKLSRHFHKEAGEGHPEFQRKILPPSQTGFKRSGIPVSELEMSAKPS